MSTQLIELAVEKSAAASNPLQYANKVLATYKENGVSTVEQAQKLAVATLPQATQGAKKPSFEQHDYTDDEINALFTDLENLEI